MDMTVAGIGSVVVAELRAAGYQESTIGQYARTIKVLARFAAGRGSDYSPELGAEFASMTVSPRTGRFSAQRRMAYGRLTRVFDSDARTGRVDLSVCGRGGGPRPAKAALAALDAAWDAEMAGRGLAAATREAYGRVARGYLVFLEQRGIRPTGIVAKMIIHASRSSLSATASRSRRSRMLMRTLAGRLRKKPRMILIQSARKNHISARAVAQCSATM
jgi:hypothetical protein